MFRFFRRYQKSLIVVGGVVLMFVFLVGDYLGNFGPAPGGGTAISPSATFATWNGGKLTHGQFDAEFNKRQILNRFLRTVHAMGRERAMAAGSEEMLPPVDLIGFLDEQANVDQVRLEVVIDKILTEQARQRGIRVSNKTLETYIAKLGYSQLSSSDLRAALSMIRSSLSSDYILEALEDAFLAHTMRTVYGTNSGFNALLAVEMPLDRWRAWRQVNDLISVEAAALKVENFESEVPEPTDQQLRELYEEYKEVVPAPHQVVNVQLPSPNPAFAIPRKVKLQYLSADFNAAVEKFKSQVTDEEVKEYYENNKGLFRKAAPLDLFGPFPGQSEDEMPEGQDPAEGTPEEETPAEGTQEPVEDPATEAPTTGEPTEESPATPSGEGGEQPAAEPAPEATPGEQPAEEPAGQEPAMEEPASLWPAEEGPAEEEPAAEEPAAEEPAGEEPTGDTPATEEPAGEEPNNEEPNNEEPSSQEPGSEEPAAAEPAAEQPEASGLRIPSVHFVSYQADDQQPAAAQEEPAPVEEPSAPSQPAETDSPPAEQPAPTGEEGGDTPPAEAPAETAGEEAPTEQPATDQQPTEEEPEEEYQSLEEVSDRIREDLARARADQELGPALDAAMERLQVSARAYRRQLLDVAEGAPLPPAPEELVDLTPLATEFNLIYEETQELDYFELSETTIGNAVNDDFLKVFNLAFGESITDLYRPFSAMSVELESLGDRYIVMKSSDTPYRVPPFDEVKSEVRQAWIRREAAKLAEKRAEEFATKAAEAGQTLKEFFAGDEQVEVVETNAFSWYSQGEVASPQQGPNYKLSQPVGLKNVGPEFMEVVFGLRGEEVKGVLNYDRSIAYVVRIANEIETEESLRNNFLANANGWDGRMIFRRSNMQSRAQAISALLGEELNIEVPGLQDLQRSRGE